MLQAGYHHFGLTLWTTNLVISSWRPPLTPTLSPELGLSCGNSKLLVEKRCSFLKSGIICQRLLFVFSVLSLTFDILEDMAIFLLITSLCILLMGKQSNSLWIKQQIYLCSMGVHALRQKSVPMDHEFVRNSMDIPLLMRHYYHNNLHFIIASILAVNMLPQMIIKTCRQHRKNCYNGFGSCASTCAKYDS